MSVEEIFSAKQFDNSPPKEEEIVQAISEALVASGVDPAACDILPKEHFLPEYQNLTSEVKRSFPVHIAVVKSSGLILYFAAAGPSGIHARIIANREATKSVH
jgi:hypothetical protein